jgi:hypothetical protein
MKYMAARAILISSIYLVACSSDGAPPPRDEPDAAAPAPDAAPTRKRDPFNGDCTTANWSSGSNDECWACMCNTCAATLNKCNDDCVDFMQCALDEHVLVGKATELACEVRGVAATCATDPAKKAADDAATAFDICLIGARTSDVKLRICEKECGIDYTDDVCQRFPSPDAGH